MTPSVSRNLLAGTQSTLLIYPCVAMTHLLSDEISPRVLFSRSHVLQHGVRGNHISRWLPIQPLNESAEVFAPAQLRGRSLVNGPIIHLPFDIHLIRRLPRLIVTHLCNSLAIQLQICDNTRKIATLRNYVEVG